MLMAQTIIALCMFAVGLEICCVTQVFTFNRLRWLVKEGQTEDCTTMWVPEKGQQAKVCTMTPQTQLTDMDLSFGNPAPGATALAYTLPGASLGPSGEFVKQFTEYGGHTANVTFAFVLVVMTLGVVQVTRLHRGRPALCGKPGVWASRVLLWTSGLLVHILFFVQVLIIAVLLILDSLCPPGVASFAVDARGYCEGSRLRGGIKAVGEMAAWICLGYFLVHYALVLTASALNAEFAVAYASRLGLPLLG